MWRTLIASPFVAAGLSVATAAAQNVSLAPHHAIYDLSMPRVTESGEILGASGRIEYRVSETCEAWDVEHTIDLTLLGNGGRSVESRSETRAHETKDGLLYQFEVRTFTDGDETESLSGEARLSEAGGRGRVVFSEGEPDSAALPEGTLFPIAHSIASIRAAQNGERLFWGKVFDGSERTKIYNVNVVIGDRRTVDEGVEEVLLRQPSWHMAVAYFERGAPGRTEQSPVFQFAGPMFVNGVSGSMTLNYGDFVLRGELRELEALERPDC